MSVKRLMMGAALMAAIALASTVRPARAAMLHMQADPAKTEIKTSVAEPLGTLRDNIAAVATFRLITSEIDGDPANVAATGHIKLVIDATTYDSNNDMRDRNVIHAALETATYQTIVFDSTRLEDVQFDSPGVSGSATVVGNLTLHGTTRQIKVPVEVSMSADGEFSATGEFTFDYTDYGVKAPRLLFTLPAGHDVTVTFRVIAERPGSPAAAPSPLP